MSVGGDPDVQQAARTLQGRVLPSNQDADLELSVSEVVRLVAGLGRATRDSCESSSEDGEVTGRLVALLFETSSLLLQGLAGDVDVRRSFLERVEFAWATTDPIGNATEMDYRWLRNLLGKL